MAFLPPVVCAGRAADYGGRWTLLLILATLTAMLLGFNYGYDLGVTGGVTGMKPFRAYFFPSFEGGEKGLWCHFSDPYLQLVTSTAYIASVPATFLAFWLHGWGSRVVVLFLGGVAYTIAAAVQSTSQNLGMLYTGRAIVGVGMAFGNQAAPVYMSEMALPKSRGLLTSSYQFAVVIGVLTAQLINYGTGKMADNGWRISLAAFGLPSLLVLMWSPFLPDTPGSLLSRGKQKEAKRTLERLRGTQDVELEWEDMVDEIEGEEAQRRRAMQAPHLSSHNRFQRSQLAGTIKWAWGYRAHLTICFMLGAFRTLTGNPLLLFYAPELFQTLGTSQDYSLLSAVTQGGAKVFGNVMAIILVDRVGRKKLQLFGGVGQLVMQIAATLITAVWFGNEEIDDSDAWALTVVLCLFEVFFEISIATLSWVIACEICPLEIRSVGAGFHCMGDLMLQILFSQLNLTMMCYMEYGVFIMAAGFCILFILFSLFLIPETKGVPLEQVQEVLRTHWLWGRMQPNGGAPGSGRAEPTASGEVELGEPAKVRSTGQPGEVEGSEAKA